ncbi:MAG: hypothetical protein LUI60_03075 [Clostridia bacterium]|nr:hypothetical protein [Clostridia bacterium]
MFGGGSGSAAINSALCKIVPELCSEYNVIHICGKGNIRQNNINGYRQYEYIDDMGAAYTAADCAVARCGSNSAFELIANKIPTLFIPLENKASRGDQLQNADYFYKKGLCRVLRQRELTPENLLREIKNTIEDANLEKNLEMCDIQSGNAKIIAEIEKVIGI